MFDSVLSQDWSSSGKDKWLKDAISDEAMSGCARLTLFLGNWQDESDKEGRWLLHDF